jgi:hypothetical protein
MIGGTSLPPMFGTTTCREFSQVLITQCAADEKAKYLIKE